MRNAANGAGDESLFENVTFYEWYIFLVFVDESFTTMWSADRLASFLRR